MTVEQRTKLLALDTKMKDNVTDLDKRWITTWNGYLGDLKYLFRWYTQLQVKDKRRPRPGDSVCTD